MLAGLGRVTYKNNPASFLLNIAAKLLNLHWLILRYEHHLGIVALLARKTQRLSG